MILDDAIVLATEAHARQTDKAGEPYILHPLRVMLDVSEKSRVVAVLHDTIEDTRIDIGWLEAKLTRIQWDALWLVTRAAHGTAKQLTYRDYIDRIATATGTAGTIAREVKRADLRDNLNRMQPAFADLESRYRDAWEVLAS